MKPGDDCGICYQLVTLHCELHGQADPGYCELRQQYLTTDMDGDQLIAALIARATPAQAAEVEAELVRRPVPTPDQIHAAAAQARQAGDPGQAAAQAWLTHWRNGK